MKQGTLFGEEYEQRERLRNPVLTAKVGLNADLFADIARLYIPEGSRVLDMTYGLGNFWRPDVREKYNLVTMDIERTAMVRAELEHLPFRSESFDAAVLDPPYANHGSGHNAVAMKEILAAVYNLKANNSTVNILRMYREGIQEAARIARTVVVKCQDHIESGKQHWNHVSVMAWLPEYGLTVDDVFVLVQNGTPTMRHNYQHHARKNHSYFIVGRKSDGMGKAVSRL